MHSPQRTARAAVKSAHFGCWSSHIHGRAHGGPQFRVSHGQLQRRRNIDVASGISMVMAHRACVCRWCILAALGGVPRCWLDCPRRRPAPKRQRAPGVPGCSCEGAPWKQISDPFNYDFPMRAIMYSFYHEWIHVSYLRGGA